MELIFGLLIGFAITATGVGGGILTVPLLMGPLGLPSAEAVGTALLFAAITKIQAAVVYLYRRQVDSSTLKLMLSGGVPAALAGAVLLDKFRGAGGNGAVMSIIGVIILLSASLALFQRRSPHKPQRPRPEWLPFLSIPIGLEVGFSSAGAGALGTVVLLRFTSLDPMRAVATDLLFGLGVSLAGGSFHLATGNWNANVLLKLIAGGVVGVPLGAFASGILPPRMLRSAILVWAVFLGGLILRQGLNRFQ